METISVIVITYNEEPHIDTCLRSVSWVDEIVVVDCGSTDRTVEICNGHDKVRLYHEGRHGSGQQKQQALDRAVSEWVLNLDADERLSEPLQSEIQSLLEASAPCDGYHIRRENHFLARHIRHAAGWGDDRPAPAINHGCAVAVDSAAREPRI